MAKNADNFVLAQPWVREMHDLLKSGRVFVLFPEDRPEPEPDDFDSLTTGEMK